MKKLMLAVLLVSPCLATENSMNRFLLHNAQRPAHLLVVAGIAAIAANQPQPIVQLDRPKAKSVQPKKYAREQKNQKLPRPKHAKGKQPRR